MDHKNLSYFRMAQRLNRQQACWSLYLSRFDFTLTHCPAKLMGKPDALLRRADHPRGEGDNTDVTLLHPEWFEVRMAEGAAIGGEETGMLERIRGGKEYDEVVAKALRELGKGSLCSDEWSRDGDLVFHRG